MLYQREFQNNEEPAKHHISCFGYETEADRQYPTHCHAYCEMSYLVSGERYQIINGQRYKVEPGRVASFCFLHFVCTVITTLRSARIW